AHPQHMLPPVSRRRFTPNQLSSRSEQLRLPHHLINLSQIVEADLRLRQPTQPLANLFIPFSVAQHPISHPPSRHAAQQFLGSAQGPPRLPFTSFPHFQHHRIHRRKPTHRPR